MFKLAVILRTCDKVEAFSGTKKRDFGSKSTVMRKCIQSLANTIAHFRGNGGFVEVYVVDDHSSEEMKQYILDLLAPLMIEMELTGNGPSFGKCVDLAAGCKSDLVLLAEDDYLWREEALLSMVKTYEKVTSQHCKEVCIHPSDYPDRYNQLDPVFLVLGHDRHYRSITKTTCTFMYHSRVFKDMKDTLKIFCGYGIIPGITEDNSINLVYEKYPCISPIPSLAEHYQYKETLSPFFKE